MHWSHAISMVILALTGLQIYAPESFRLFADMDWARYLHFIFMYLVTWTFIYKVYYVLATGEIKELLFTFKDFLQLPALAAYYLYGIFAAKKKRDWGKYNPGQKLTYTGWLILLPLQALTGFALYWPGFFAGFNEMFGGMGYVKLWHFCISWIFILTTAVHIYLGTTGATIWDYYKSMLSGWEKAH
jgi:Ni/Fe-hydrogenase 1 B-type cytochrome subunit